MSTHIKQGSGVNRAPLMWRMRFWQPLASQGVLGQSQENVIQLGREQAIPNVVARDDCTDQQQMSRMLAKQVPKKVKSLPIAKEDAGESKNTSQTQGFI